MLLWDAWGILPGHSRWDKLLAFASSRSVIVFYHLSVLKRPCTDIAACPLICSDLLLFTSLQKEIWMDKGWLLQTMQDHETPPLPRESWMSRTSWQAFAFFQQDPMTERDSYRQRGQLCEMSTGQQYQASSYRFRKIQEFRLKELHTECAFVLYYWMSCKLNASLPCFIE